MTFGEKIRIKITSFLNYFSKPIMLKGKYLPTTNKPKNTRISSSTFIDYPQNLILGENVYIGLFNFIEASNGIEIREGCQITNYISITSHSSHDSIRLYGKHYVEQKDPIGYLKGSIEIGAYTFVGPYCLINPGTVVGKGSLIHANSVLKGTYPDFAILKGNPAEIIGSTKNRDAKYLKDFPELNSFYYDKVL